MHKQLTPSIVAHALDECGDLRTQIGEQANAPVKANASIGYGQFPKNPEPVGESTEVQNSMVPALPPTSVPCTLVFYLPLFYNAGLDGIRPPIEPEKFHQTESEIRETFCGYSRSFVSGWWRDPLTGEESIDDLCRYEIDGTFNAAQINFLLAWKRQLELRFSQKSIYFRFSSPVICW